MNKPPFDPSQPYQAVDKPPFDPSQPFKAVAESQPGRSFLGINRKNLPATISKVARPLLEVGGAAAGAAIGAPAGPVGVFTGGSTGLSGGIAASDLVDRLLGVKKPLKNVPDAVKETGGDIKQGVEGEMMGQSGGVILQKAARPVAKMAGNLGRIISGVKPQMGERLFNDPGALFTPSTEKVGAELGKIRGEMGMTSKPTIDEVIDTEASTARKTVKMVYDKFKAGTASALDLLKGTQAMDDVIEATPMKQMNKRRMLFDQKREFTEALKDVAGPERAAAKKYARSALGGEFRKFFPVTKSGDVSVMRTLGLGALEGGAKAAAIIPSLLQSPLLSGTGISTAGALYKALANPGVRRALIAAAKSQTND